MNVLMVSLGCDKNLCDSEAMLGLLAKGKFHIVSDESSADAVIVNTCSFIRDAMEESINTILEMAQLKSGRLKYLVVAGCLAQRFKEQILEEIPEIDACVGTTSFDKIVDVLLELSEGDEKNPEISGEKKKTVCVYDDISRPVYVADCHRVITSGTFMGYLKIAEGCDKRCTYCVIPHIRGNYRSVPMEQLVAEGAYMASQGITELVLVAQECTCYGRDLYGEKKLHELIYRLAEIDGIRWIRLMYCYPEEIYDELIDCFRREPKLLAYIDMPMQHAQTSILKRMGRKTDRASICSVIRRLREAVPHMAFRTSLIAGFPGETEEDHQALLDFLYETELDHVGVFTYSREEGTPAYDFPDQVDEETANIWRDEIMELQQDISHDKNQTFVGKVLDVIIEGYSPEEDVYVGRTYRDAPEVDGLTFVSCDYELMSGAIVPVLIKEAGPYDMIGGIVDEPAE